jgi:hypothetical protein
MSCKANGSLKWYCEDCGDDINLIVECDPAADIGGFTVEGFHIHVCGEMIELPPMYIAINSMDDFRDFAEVMRQVRENIKENE